MGDVVEFSRMLALKDRLRLPAREGPDHDPYFSPLSVTRQACPNRSNRSSPLTLVWLASAWEYGAVRTSRPDGRAICSSGYTPHGTRGWGPCHGDFRGAGWRVCRSLPSERPDSPRGPAWVGGRTDPNAKRRRQQQSHAGDPVKSFYPRISRIQAALLDCQGTQIMRRIY